MTIYGLASGVIVAVLLFISIIIFLVLGITDGNPFAIFFAALTGVNFLMGILLLVAIAVFQLAVVIFATIKAFASFSPCKGRV